MSEKWYSGDFWIEGLNVISSVLTVSLFISLQIMSKRLQGILAAAAMMMTNVNRNRNRSTPSSYWGGRWSWMCLVVLLHLLCHHPPRDLKPFISILFPFKWVQAHFQPAEQGVHLLSWLYYCLGITLWLYGYNFELFQNSHLTSLPVLICPLAPFVLASVSSIWKRINVRTSSRRRS